MAASIHVVTGGAGFIGSHIARTLVAQGQYVRIVDDLSSGKRENLETLEASSFEFYETDIRDAEKIAPAFAGARYVYHHAAVASVARSIDDPASTLTTNIDGTLNVLLAARDAGARKVVFASSSAVYGDSDTIPKHEGLETNPLSPYAVSKTANEMLAGIFPDVYGLETLGLRYFNVFGPYQDPNSDYAAVIPKFITRMLDGKPPVIYGDGEQTRDFIFIDNVVAANLAAAQSTASGLSVNVACEGRYSLNELVATLNDCLKTDFEPRYEKPRSGDIRNSQADISKARESFGFQPEIDFREGLDRTVEWYRQQRAG